MVFRIVTKDDIEAAAERQSTSLAAVALLLLLIVSGVLVARELMVLHAFEGCLASGRHHCAESVRAMYHFLPSGWNGLD